MRLARKVLEETAIHGVCIRPLPPVLVAKLRGHIRELSGANAIATSTYLWVLDDKDKTANRTIESAFGNSPIA